MQQATTEQAVTLASITLAAMQSYNDYCKADLQAASATEDYEDAAAFAATYLQDLHYMQAALNDFLQSNNAHKFYHVVMQQNAFVRDFYASVTQYLLQNNLCTS